MVVGVIRDAFQQLHDQSLPSIELLQTSFPRNQNLMINISTLFDPRYVFLILVPIMYSLNRRVGHRLVVALTGTEWANQILKWLLAGERPYWYVHERALELAAEEGRLNNSTATTYAATDSNWAAQQQQQQQAPTAQLRQFPVTCELGAGSPSGHAMVTATVWYIIMDAYFRGELVLGFHARLARLGWALYAMILFAVSLSRVYLACHFPHQCLGGALLGTLVARLIVQHLHLDRLKRYHFYLATGCMLATALATFALLRSFLGLDPLWSVHKGMRWCVRKEYIHMDTTPFFSMVRYLGFCMGAGLAFEPSRYMTKNGQRRISLAERGGHLLVVLTRVVVASSAAILLGQISQILPIPKGNLPLFYVISFFVNTMLAYAMAGPIPDQVEHLLGLQPLKKFK